MNDSTLVKDYSVRDASDGKVASTVEYPSGTTAYRVHSHQ